LLAAVLCLLVFSWFELSQLAAQTSPGIININVSHSIQTVNCWVNRSTKVDFRGLELSPRAEGHAKIESKNGRRQLTANSRTFRTEDRAAAVCEYLVTRGLNPGSIATQGAGETTLVGDKQTAAGRQMSRRVEIIVSGEVIGTKIGKMRILVRYTQFSAKRPSSAWFFSWKRGLTELTVFPN
jgi:hypothetical protein